MKKISCRQIWGLKLSNSGLKKISTKYFSGTEMHGNLFFHISSPRLKLLIRPYAYLMHPDYRIHQNLNYQIKVALTGDWYNNCCLRYIFLSLIAYRLFINFLKMILMKLRYILLFAVSSMFLFSCVSKKKFTEMQTEMQARFDSLSAEYAKLQGELKTCNDKLLP